MDIRIYEIPIEVFNIILESSVIVMKMRMCCKYLRNILKSLYHQKKLGESVYTSKLFFPKSLLRLTQQEEYAMYYDQQNINIYYGNEVAYYATFHKDDNNYCHWVAHCKVPSACYVDCIAHDHFDSTDRWNIFKSNAINAQLSVRAGKWNVKNYTNNGKMNGELHDMYLEDN
jgi:hypothetical protein